MSAEERQEGVTSKEQPQAHLEAPGSAFALKQSPEKLQPKRVRTG